MADRPATSPTALDPILIRTEAIIRHGDLSQLTFKIIMTILGDEFGPEAKLKKAQIRQVVDRSIESIMAAANAAGNGRLFSTKTKQMLDCVVVA